MALTELFTSDLATTTVTSGGTGAPGGGSSETWTVASSAMFGAAVTGVSQFHVQDPAAGYNTETIAVTNVSGTTWTVTRGAESTTPVAHLSGFTVNQVITAGWLSAVLAAPVSGRYLCAPTMYAPSAQTGLATSSTTLVALTGAASTVAAGSNGGEISQVATWATPGAGVLAVANGTLFPSGGGTVNVAASGATTAVVTFTGVSGNTLTGCAYVSGSATGTLTTGGAVTLTSAAAFTGSFTAPASGSVIVTVSLVCTHGTTSDFLTFGLGAYGSATPVCPNNVTQSLSALKPLPYTMTFLVTGLSGTNNLALLAGTEASTLTVDAFGTSSSTAGSTPGAPVIMTVQAV